MNWSWLKAAFVNVTGSGQCSFEVTMCCRKAELRKDCKKDAERTHVDLRVKSPHEGLIPKVFNYTRPTEMVNDVCQVLDLVFQFSGSKFGVEI